MAASEAQVRALTGAYRTSAQRQAALVALLVAAYYRQQVNVDDPGTIARWIDLLVPRILTERDKVSELAARYGDTLRKLERPDLADGFRFTKAPPLDEKAIRISLSVVGPGQASKAYREIRESDLDPGMKQALLEVEDRKAETRIIGSVERHVQDGGRETLQRGAAEDRVALGWVRITDGDPCYFCAMLASRGLEFGAYGEDSFARSDARFVGDGKIKVHDHCSCHPKAVYSEDDPFLKDAERFEEMWREYSRGGGAFAIKTFRQAYEGRAQD